MNAATVRLAGTHVNIAPLALPSPEHELTDPMRTIGASGRHVTVPGTVPEHEADSSSDYDEGNESLSDSVLIESDVDFAKIHANILSPDFRKFGDRQERKGFEESPSVVTTPGGTKRRVRISQELKKFWRGTRDVDGPSGSYDEPDEDDVPVLSPTPKDRVKAVKFNVALEDDYFTRGREFSGSSSHNIQSSADTNGGLTPSELEISSCLTSTDSVADLADPSQNLSISGTAQLTASPQPAKMSFSSSSFNSRGPGGSNIVPSSIPIPTPLLSAYSFPYPYDRSHVVMHPHPGGAMTVPVPSVASNNPPSFIEVSPSAINIPEPNAMDGLPSRRIALMRQISAPLPVGSGSSATLGGKMDVGMPMPPQVLPSLTEAEKNNMLLGSEDTFPSVENSMLEAPFSINSREQPAPPLEKSKTTSGMLSNSASIEAMGVLINAGQSPSMRAAKEEQMFRELGYLAAPNPPDEVERRRALYKCVHFFEFDFEKNYMSITPYRFNIWNTGSDLNFDRIAHLAKLVFNTKGVFISLVDGNEQWLKSECMAWSFLPVVDSC